jgi:hypothetical protein
VASTAAMVQRKSGNMRERALRTALPRFPAASLDRRSANHLGHYS